MGHEVYKSPYYLRWNLLAVDSWLRKHLRRHAPVVRLRRVRVAHRWVLVPELERGAGHAHGRVAVRGRGGGRRPLAFGRFLLRRGALLQLGDGVVQMSRILYNIGHGKINIGAPPRQFERHVRRHDLVARIQRRAEALLVADVHEEPQQIFRQCWVAGSTTRVDRVLVHLVRLAQPDGLLPALVLLVDGRRDSSKFK